MHLFPGDAPRRLNITLLHRRVTDPDIQGHTVSCPLLQMKAGAVLALRHLAGSGALVLAAAAHTLLDFAPTTGRNDSLGLVKSVFQTWVLLGQGRGEESRGGEQGGAEGAGVLGVAARVVEPCLVPTALLPSSTACFTRRRGAGLWAWQQQRT